MDEAIPADSLGLTRVTVQTARRSADVALPGDVVVADLLPHIVRIAGVAPPDDSTGWMLRRAAGAPVGEASSLDAQGIRDGELLCLVPKRMEWPEPAFDDTLEMISEAAGRLGPRWTGRARRVACLAAGVLLLFFALVLLALDGPQWDRSALAAAGGAVVLASAGIVVVRGAGNTGAGTALGLLAPVYAGAAGLFGLLPPDGDLADTGAPSVLVGSSAVLVTGVLAGLGLGTARWLLSATVTVGLAGLAGALICLAGATAGGAAGVVLVITAGLLPAYPTLALRLGRVPFPELPVIVDQAAADGARPSRARVRAAVAGSADLLTGMILGTAVTGAVATVLLIRGGGVSGMALAGCAGAVLALRSRMFPLLAQRVPLLVVAVLAAGLLAGSWLDRAGTLSPLVVIGAAGAGFVLLAAAGSPDRPGPYLGRAADVVDALATIAFVPLACGALGFFGLLPALVA